MKNSHPGLGESGDEDPFTRVVCFGVKFVVPSAAEDEHPLIGRRWEVVQGRVATSSDVNTKPETIGKEVHTSAGPPRLPYFLPSSVQTNALWRF